jgi:HlyD family secretion protein/epimerase transport system membrane fusion protein
MPDLRKTSEATTPGNDKSLQEVAAPGENAPVLEGEILPGARMKERKLDHKAAFSGGVEDPRRIIRFGMIVIGLFFGALGIWAFFGTISGAVVAPGKVKIETERKTVQHLEGGIIDSILVREGEKVVAGQTLITLESIQVDAAVDMHRKQLIAHMSAQARHAAEKDLKETITWPEELRELAEEASAEDILSNEEKIFIARREALRGQISMLRTQIAQIDAQISGLEEQYRAEQAIIATLNEELKAKRQLFVERYLEKSQILELERMLASHMGTRGHLKQSIAETKQRRIEKELSIDDLTNRFVEESTNMLGRLDNEILQTREKLRPLQNAKTRLNVVAPVAGRVVGLKVHSRGGVVRSGEPLMDIVPDDNPMIVEVQVPVNKVTEVYAGQDALVQLDAFDIGRVPPLPSKVAYISADRLEEQTYAGKMPYYLCYVEIDPKAIEDANVYLSPGMPATAFITTKEKTILFYMLEPLIRYWDLALRD